MDGFSLRSLDAFFFDLDGCVYYGDYPAPGSRELLRRLRSEHKRVLFLTNNSTHNRHELARKLMLMGIEASADEIFTATDCAGPYIRQMYGKVRVKTAGSDSLRDALREAGHTLLDMETAETADVIVLGRDTGFTYDKLQRLAEEAERGARLIGTNTDPYHLGARGQRVPETGALAASLESMLGRRLEYYGKPNPFMFEYAMKQYMLQPAACVMVGDNPLTDMAGGMLSGMRTVWVRGGSSFFSQESATAAAPDAAVHDLQELLEAYVEG